MNRFQFVSSEQYVKDCLGDKPRDFNTVSNIIEEYKELKLPKRATKYSAGYDFFAPCDIVLNPGQEVVIPTGIKCELDEDKFLAIYPRSGLGFKFKERLANTVGIIDCDYFNNEKNEGHIMIKICNENNQMKKIVIQKGTAFAQGIITQFFKVENDTSNEVRNGGFGSTTK